MIKIFHEMPLSMLLDGTEERLTDGHYALVHLYVQSRKYYDYTISQLKKGRDVILDNSVFELREAFKADEFASWIESVARDTSKEIVNNYLTYVIPDVLGDAQATVFAAENFLRLYSDLPGKKMAVVQGNTLPQLVSCYKDLNRLTRLDRTGVGFHYKAYDSSESPNLLNQMHGRERFINMLIAEGYIKSPLHLLGCSLPQEFKAYKNRPEIASIDTSNPVIHGLFKLEYNEAGLNTKILTKLADLFYQVPDAEQLAIIEKNCTIFRSFVNG